jgi:CRISPR/Cas system-associated exonuclease Cas4 (RecB family)
LQSYFYRTIPFPESIESAWAKLRGTLLHYAGRSLGWSELQVRLTFPLDNEQITVVGFVDAYDPETATVYDLKTTRFVKWQNEKNFIPRENHTVQIQAYYTLLNLYEIPVKRLVLVYVDDRDIIAKQVAVLNRREWLTERAIRLHRFITDSQLPSPEVSVLCKYCPFVKQCPSFISKLRCNT